ncbi:hypothetical protein Tco_0073099, partial [Tanacetum coccineum]
VINSPCFLVKSWLVQDQTVLGKDYSNLLIADSLLKTIWFINAPCYDNEALASPNTNDEELSIPEQTATGKGTSNPLMAGSLPKTTKPTFYVIEPNDSDAINSIIESRDAIFDEHMFSSVPRPSQRSLVKGTNDSSGLVVSERVTDEIVQQSEPRKSKRHKSPKDFGPEFQ